MPQRQASLVIMNQEKHWQPPLLPSPESGTEAESGFHQHSPRMRLVHATPLALQDHDYHTVTSIPRAPY